MKRIVLVVALFFGSTAFNAGWTEPPDATKMTDEELSAHIEKLESRIQTLRKGIAEKEALADEQSRLWQSAQQEQQAYQNELHRQQNRARLGAVLQAVGATMAQQQQQQRQLQQQQEFYRQMNRPRTTNCNSYGYGYGLTTNCTSH